MSITQTQTEPIGTDYEICHSGQRSQPPVPPVISSGGLSFLSLLSFRAEASASYPSCHFERRPLAEVEKSVHKLKSPASALTPDTLFEILPKSKINNILQHIIK